ncbi:hypothetical protein OF001_U20360 [Pseudomonas sp. OF001]|uniref:hypothetical protein n=1 Tax=Pseudomonas sp. OF001 TaxID=2772300 RepID=UPI001919D5DD|nr:hypothetical protein [Pseudomonas sp. OF001]CAD5377433.1 hypothetical protein OF001_U20360 [Pseudomonas sp. OF001]
MNAARSLSMCAASLALVALVGFAIQTSVENYRHVVARDAVESYRVAFQQCMSKTKSTAAGVAINWCDYEARTKTDA